ncbi:glutathione S-transferase family protein [Halomonas sp. FeN2]|uniref:glutathione S-transferase family protein n=1 Tax=Halomonas sp. FeN2 TaxID=2832500 RepID=UPI001D09B7F0|nr:glutathione S-transferase family protein [Halomonas sp. FeN2]
MLKAVHLSQRYYFRIRRHRYLLGDQFTYADILMVAALSQVPHTNLLDMFPNVISGLTRCHDRPAWHKCLDVYNRRLAKFVSAGATQSHP